MLFTVQWPAMVLTLGVQRKASSFLTSWTTFRFPRSLLINAIGACRFLWPDMKLLRMNELEASHSTVYPVSDRQEFNYFLSIFVSLSSFHTRLRLSGSSDSQASSSICPSLVPSHILPSLSVASFLECYSSHFNLDLRLGGGGGIRACVQEHKQYCSERGR
jgi:hypothetical protein